MILTRIVVRHFRGIPEARFEDLSDRLCLFHGPNETGKSTLVEAVHFALFERAAGVAEYKKSLRSWGRKEAPEVEVSLIDDLGRQWDVHKRFLDTPRTEVWIDQGVRLTGNAAEARLRELLGTRPGTSRGIPIADLGVWPLVWVRQGQAGWPSREVLTDEARAALSGTLAAQTGLLAVGPEGLRLLEATRAEHDRWWTPQDRPTQALRQILEAAQEAELRLADLEDALHATRALGEDLRRLEVEVTRLEAGARAQRTRVDEARTGAERAARAQEALAQEDRAVALARVGLEAATAALRRRRGLEESGEAARRREVAITAELRRLEVGAESLEQQRRERQAAVERIEEEAAGARAIVRNAERAELREVLQTQIEALRARVEAAEEVAEQLRVVRDAAAATGVSARDVERVEAALAEHDRAQAALRATTARLVMVARRDLVVSGTRLPAGEERRFDLEDGLVVDLDGLVVLRVEGQGAPEALPTKAREARVRLEALLLDLGVSDPEEARARSTARQRLEHEAQPLRARLEVLAPQGTAPLRAELRQLEARQATVPEVAPPPEARERALAVVEEAGARMAEARAALEVVEGSLRTLREALAEQRALQGAMLAEVRKAEVELEGQPGLQRLEDLAGQAREELQRAEAARAVRAASFERAGGEAAARSHRDERVALERLEGRRDAARAEVALIRLRLEERTAAGTWNKVQEARATLHAARREAAAAERAAAVARRARTALETAQRALQERFAGPVREVVREGVALLFPGSTLAFDERGDVIGLRTGEVVEGFDDLSGGAREQLGVLVRLGLAQVLAGGRRLPVLLDDALVNSDSDRRARMVEVLRRASEHLQVLVFTSHDEDFDRLGAPWHTRVQARPRRIS
jgi:DNA repair exonuclease SbcCD ATPase subunit